MGFHANEAEQLLISAKKHWMTGTVHNVDSKTAMFEIAAAQVHATLALMEKK